MQSPVPREEQNQSPRYAGGHPDGKQLPGNGIPGRHQGERE